MRPLFAFFVLFSLFFFLLSSSFAYAAAPTLGTLAPSIGATAPDISRTFTAVYSDADGWTNIRGGGFLVSTSSNALTNTAYLYYDQNTNLLYLKNDANSAWLGGYAPGSANIIENSQIKLNCVSTTATGSGTNLTVSWNLTFKPAFSGKSYKTYLSVVDDTNVSVGWTQKGTYAVNYAPTITSLTTVSSLSQVDTPFAFEAVYADTDGWQNLRYAYILVNTAIKGNNSFYAYYDRASNKLYLRNDANSAWLGGYAPGSVNTIENSQVKIDCAKTSVSGMGSTMTVSWGVVFKAAFMGSKNIYLYAQDSAGANSGWKQKGACTIIEAGTIVDSSGGEVVSSDGKVRLTVPAGALSAPRGIEILAVSRESMTAAAPVNASLLSVAECRPYGLVFNKPVSLAYALNQAEVPGTPVELGLYDSAQAKIVSTGQRATVGADGYTAAFSIEHFSMYAALKNLVPQGAPIGAGVRIPLPDMFTGAFSHAVPLPTAPGRRGMQPALAISYRSGNPNSWVGLGASMNPGHIARSTRLGPPSYDDFKDTFYFVTDAGATELVWLIDNLYQAKIESSFTKFYKEADDSWRVVAKDGSVLRLGATPDSKETAVAGTFAWYLTRATDTNGNYIEYAYTQDQGKIYLSRIDYTGHESGVAPTSTVEFTLEPREDVFSSYMSTAKITTALRLKEVVVKVSGELVWRHVLEYAYSPDTHRSLLVGVTTYAADGKALPAQRMMYQESK